MATPQNKSRGGFRPGHRWVLPWLGTWLLLLPLLVAGAPRQELDAIVAVVNNDVIVRSELERRSFLPHPSSATKGPNSRPAPRWKDRCWSV